MSLDNYIIEVAKTVKRLKEAVKLFNTIKSHAYYQKLKHYKIVAKRTGTTNLNVLIATIPQTRNPEKPEYLVIAAYVSREKVMQRIDFVRRLEYVMRFIKKLMSVDGSGWWHAFIYFMGKAFRAGVYEEAKRTRKVFMGRGLDINLRIIELRYEGRDLTSIIYEDLLRFLGSRAYRILNRGNYSRSEGKVFGKLKHLLDYIIAILTSLKEGKKGLLRIEDLMREHEEYVDTYLDLLKELGYEGVKKVRPTKPKAALHITYAPTIKLTKQNLSSNEHDYEEGSGENYEVVEDRYERIDDDVEVI